MAVNEVVSQYPEVRTRMQPALWRKLSRLAQALGTTPPGAVRILVAQADACTPSVTFGANTDAANSESASIEDADGALLYTTQSTAEKQTAHCYEQ